MKIIISLLFCWFFVSSGIAQLKYPVEGRYNNCSAQAMAIFEDWAYVFNDGGHCRIFDLSSSSKVADVDLATANIQNHVNAACFGVEKPKGSKVPYIYISECKNEYRCFVEYITQQGSTLVQTIRTSFQGKSIHAPIWVVDTKEKVLYRVGRTDKTLKEKGYSINTITGFRLPSVAEGSEVVLSEKDVICQYDIYFPSILQDACIKKGKMYLATGLQQSNASRLDSKRAIHVIDLRKKKLVKTIDQTLLTTNEPEGIDFYGKYLLLFCGQEGGIYLVKK